MLLRNRAGQSCWRFRLELKRNWTRLFASWSARRQSLFDVKDFLTQNNATSVRWRYDTRANHLNWKSNAPADASRRSFTARIGNATDTRSRQVQLKLLVRAFVLPASWRNWQSGE